ncbi:MAG TPA: electron transfer flavoprotein subunit alpha/FixB family protein [Bryobacteraceae bacterium]|nr:electron transfer flavoprotein subunit alpha/FixB family protein [Bryobacteraceae bacterium]
MILVFLERSGSQFHRSSLEALAAGQQLGAELNLPVASVVIGDGAPEVPAGAVYSVRHDLLQDYTADGYTTALEQVIRAKQPRFVLLPHTYMVRDFAPKLATRFERVLVSDVVGIRAEGGNVVLVRQLFQGKLNADVRVSGVAPFFASIQAGVYRAEQIQPGNAQVEEFAVELDAANIRSKPEAPFRESERAVDLSAASIIVSVGRGIKEKDNLPMIEELAQALGAEIAASRPICDNGWLPMERQVGSSGQTVSPKVYVAVGISGAIQHLVGMKGAKTIVAINKDPEAPIFEVADYGVVGDLFEFVPALTAEVKKARG